MTQVLMLVVGLLAGAGIGYFVRKALIEARTGAVEVRAREIMAEAERDAMAAKSQALVEAKDEAIRIRQEGEAEAKARAAEGQRRGARLIQKEEKIAGRVPRRPLRERALAGRGAGGRPAGGQ